MKIFNPQDYDKIYRRSDKYKSKYNKSPYLRMWLRAALLIPYNSTVLDVGCGPGQFADLLTVLRPDIKYRGMDFSPVAIRMARELCPHFSFNCVDVTSGVIFNPKRRDVITMFEFLEHIKDDLKFLDKLPTGTHIIASVPNYNARNHVRIFRSIASVHNHYRNYIDITGMQAITHAPDHTIFLFNGTKK